MLLPILNVSAFFLEFYHMFMKRRAERDNNMMNFLKRQFRRMGEVKFGLVLVIAGGILGFIVAMVLKGFYWNNINIMDADYLKKIRDTSIDYSALLGYVYWNIFKPFILFWVVTVTALGIPYIGLCLTYIGFQGSFFATIVLMKYGFKGILLIFGYTFPQYLIYIPVIFLSLRSGFYLCKILHYESISRKGRSEIIIKHILLILALGILLALGGLIETYTNTFILRKILGLF